MTGMSDQYTRKSLTGEAGNKGEFGTHHRSEADVTLGAPAGLPPVTREVPVTWWVMELPTPRSRKKRPVLHEGTHPVHVRQVAAEDAPPSFEHPTTHGLTRTVRVIDGDLYENVPYVGADGHGDADQVFAVAGRGAEGTRFNESVEPLDSVTRRMDEKADDYVIIDGQAWKRTGEPVYVVEEPNLKHATVHITVQPAPADAYRASDKFYPASRLEDAKRHARALARQTAETDAFAAAIDSTPVIDFDDDVYQPGSSWKPSPRREYTRPEDTTPETLAAAYKQFVAALADVPTATRVRSDGKVDVNRFGLSPLLLADYEAFLRQGLRTSRL